MLNKPTKKAVDQLQHKLDLKIKLYFKSRNAPRVNIIDGSYLTTYPVSSLGEMGRPLHRQFQPETSLCVSQEHCRF